MYKKTHRFQNKVIHIEDPLALDLAKTDPDWIGDMLRDEMEYGDFSIKNPSAGREGVKEMFRKCGKAITLEGFETCLLSEIEKLDNKYFAQGHNPLREEVFDGINHLTEKILNDYYYEHNL